MGLGGQRHAPQFYVRERYVVPIVQNPSGEVWKLSPSPKFDPRTVQHEANSYADYATPLFVLFFIALNETLSHLLTEPNLLLIAKFITDKSVVLGTLADQAQSE